MANERDGGWEWIDNGIEKTMLFVRSNRTGKGGVCMYVEDMNRSKSLLRSEVGAFAVGTWSWSDSDAVHGTFCQA